ncbi:MAG: rhomboid family intramembrane serine protease [Chloroflexota bacterium]
MDLPSRSGRGPDPSIEGRLSREDALALLERGGELLRQGDFQDAARHYGRVIGFDDPGITAAALLGLGEARYRLDDDEGAVVDWLAATRMGETASTYPAWRNVAAARVRSGDLAGAIDAYREADRRAPVDDKAEIATRLGWLAKETGDRGAARRYFARGRGDGPLVPAWMAILGVTVVVSLSAIVSSESRTLYEALWLDKAALAAGEYYRLWTVTLLHADLLHLLFNMYALYLVGPIVERWYGSIRFVLFYYTTAAAASVASFVFGGDIPSVGASGAIFGLFGLILAAGRLHHPVDRQSRALVGQIGMLIVLNLAFGFASGVVDNAAHIGGLVAGLFLGALIPPTGVPTLSSLWQQSGARGTPARASPPVYLPVAGVLVVALFVVVGLAYGTAERTGRRAVDEPAAPPIAQVSR